LQHYADALQCLLLAQSGHPDALNQCPLLGVKRTLISSGFIIRWSETTSDSAMQTHP